MPDPVGSRLVGSLARPTGNVAGVSSGGGPEIVGKRLELLKEAAPRISRVIYIASVRATPLVGVGNRCGVPKSDGSGPCPAPVAAPGRRCPFHDDSPDARARMAQARRLGGKAPHVRAGLTPAVVETIDLSDAEGQLAVLSAATRALASGQISSTTATAIATLVKAANPGRGRCRPCGIAKLEAKIEQLVVEAPRDRR